MNGSPGSRLRTRSYAKPAIVIVTALALVTVGAVSPAFATGTTLFDQSFQNSTLTGSSPVTKPSVPSSTNVVCLTASSNTSMTPLPGCQNPAIDANGSGTLRLTRATTGVVGGALSSTSIPASSGIDIQFNSYQYGGTGADGIGFVLGAVDPNTQVPPSVTGQAGGALGYANSGGGSGYASGYLGVGLDVYGNYLATSLGGGCSNPSWAGQNPNEVTVRGPGNGTNGYCILDSTGNPAHAALQPISLKAGSRAASVVPVEVSINPTGSAFINAGGLSVPGNSYLIAFTGVGAAQKSFYGALPNASSVLNPAWLDANGVPKQLSFGWVAATGGSTDIHEVDRSVTKSATPVPVLTTTQTYKGTASGSSGSGKFTVTTTVTEAPLTAPITINGTVPSGMKLDTVTGTGWTCTIPTSTTYSCTTTGSSFPNGTTLPPITAAVTVIGPVTEEGIGTGTSSRTLSPNALSNYTTTTTVDPTPPVPPTPAVVTIGLNGPVKGKNPNKKVNLKGTTRKKTAKVYVYRATRRHGPATLVAVRTSSSNKWKANSIWLGPNGKAYFCARVGLSFSQTLLVNAQYGSTLLGLPKASPSKRGDIVYCP